MSERKSWDIQPKPRAPAQPQSAPQIVRGASARPKKRSRPAPEPVAAPIIRREKVKQGRDREPLRARRRRARRRTSLVLFTLALLLVGGIFAALWSTPFRIQHVEAAGPDATGVQTTALSSLVGTYKYVLPRNSIFFFPQDSLRTEILQHYPDVSAISISRISFDTIAINSIPRETAFLWCGTTYAPTGTAAAPTVTEVASSTASASSAVAMTATTAEPIQSPCYDTDAQGDVFAIDSDASPDMLRIYDTLASSKDATSSPLGDDISEASMIPNALQFVKAIKSLGVPIVALAIRSDEADLYAQSGTRITYVLGTEEATAEVAASAFPSLNINDGSLAYVDLRFPGKVYFKKVGASDTGASATSTYSSSVSCYLSGNCKIQ